MGRGSSLRLGETLEDKWLWCRGHPRRMAAPCAKRTSSEIALFVCFGPKTRPTDWVLTLILRDLPALGPAVVFTGFDDAQRAAVADVDAAIDVLPQPDAKRPDVDLAATVGDKQ
jgi:hypothetical protein